MCFESQLTSNVDLGVSMFMDGNKGIEIDDMLLNDATLSRYSEFGYINDKESLDHYKQVRDLLKKQSIKAPVFEALRNKFDSIGGSQQKRVEAIMNTNNNILLGNLINPVYTEKMNKMKQVIQNNPHYNQQFERFKSTITQMFSAEKQFVIKTDF